MMAQLSLISEHAVVEDLRQLDGCIPHMLLGCFIVSCCCSESVGPTERHLSVVPSADEVTYSTRQTIIANAQSGPRPEVGIVSLH